MEWLRLELFTKNGVKEIDVALRRKFCDINKQFMDFGIETDS